MAKKFRMALLFNRLTEWVDRTSLFRFWIHEMTDHSQQKEVCGLLGVEPAISYVRGCLRLQVLANPNGAFSYRAACVPTGPRIDIISGFSENTMF